MFPFNTRGKMKCTAIVVVSDNADAMKEYFKDHPLVISQRANFILVKATSDALDSIHCVNRFHLLIIEVEHRSVESTKLTIKKHRDHSESTGVDVFTIIKASPTDYSDVIQHVLNNLNCMVIPTSETTQSDWASHVFTALGAIEINKHRQYFGAVDKSTYVKAVTDARNALFASDITSESLLQVLHAQ